MNFKLNTVEKPGLLNCETSLDGSGIRKTRNCNCKT